MFITEEQNNLKQMLLDGLLTPTEYFYKLNEITQANFDIVNELTSINKEIIAELNSLFGVDTSKIDVIDFEDPDFSTKFDKLIGFSDFKDFMNN